MTILKRATSFGGGVAAIVAALLWLFVALTGASQVLISVTDDLGNRSATITQRAFGEFLANWQMWLWCVPSFALFASALATAAALPQPRLAFALSMANILLGAAAVGLSFLSSGLPKGDFWMYAPLASGYTLWPFVGALATACLLTWVRRNAPERPLTSAWSASVIVFLAVVGAAFASYAYFGVGALIEAGAAAFAGVAGLITIALLLTRKSVNLAGIAFAGAFAVFVALGPGEFVFGAIDTLTPVFAYWFAGTVGVALAAVVLCATRPLHPRDEQRSSGLSVALPAVAALAAAPLAIAAFALLNPAASSTPFDIAQRCSSHFAEARERVGAALYSVNGYQGNTRACVAIAGTRTHFGENVVVVEATDPLLQIEYGDNGDYWELPRFLFPTFRSATLAASAEPRDPYAERPGPVRGTITFRTEGADLARLEGAFTPVQTGEGAPEVNADTVWSFHFADSYGKAYALQLPENVTAMREVRAPAYEAGEPNPTGGELGELRLNNENARAFIEALVAHDGIEVVVTDSRGALIASTSYELAPVREALRRALAATERMRAH